MILGSPSVHLRVFLGELEASEGPPAGAVVLPVQDPAQQAGAEGAGDAAEEEDLLTNPVEELKRLKQLMKNQPEAL